MSVTISDNVHIMLFQMRGAMGQPGSRTGSVRSFNTQYGRHTPEMGSSPAMPPRAATLPNQAQSPQQQRFLQEQEEYRKRQQQELQAAQEAEAQRQYEQQLLMQQNPIGKITEHYISKHKC